MKTITNRIKYNTVDSDCVYPNWTDKEQFKIIGILDKDFVKEELNRVFEANTIANKYAIQMPNGIVWYQHDFDTFALLPNNNSNEHTN
jgi:hypothetical protein